MEAAMEVWCPGLDVAATRSVTGSKIRRSWRRCQSRPSPWRHPARRAISHFY